MYPPVTAFSRKGEWVRKLVAVCYYFTFLFSQESVPISMDMIDQSISVKTVISLILLCLEQPEFLRYSPFQTFSSHLKILFLKECTFLEVGIWVLCGLKSLTLTHNERLMVLRYCYYTPTRESKQTQSRQVNTEKRVFICTDL